MKFNEREQKLIKLAVFVISVFILQQFFILPLRDKWRQLDESISASELKLKKSLKMLGTKSGIEKTYKENYTRVSSRRSEQEELTWILKKIEKAAVTSGAEISKIFPQSVKKHDDVEIYGVEVVLKSTQESLIKFMNTIERSWQLLRIKKMHIKCEGSTGKLITTLSITRIRIIDKR